MGRKTASALRLSGNDLSTPFAWLVSIFNSYSTNIKLGNTTVLEGKAL